MPDRFLAIHDLPRGGASDVQGIFERVTLEARHRGIRAIETFYSTERGRAYTYVEGDSPDHVRAAFAAAGIPAVEVVHGERLYTDLLDEPHRYR